MKKVKKVSFQRVLRLCETGSEPPHPLHYYSPQIFHAFSMLSHAYGGACGGHGDLAKGVQIPEVCEHRAP